MVYDLDRIQKILFFAQESQNALIKYVNLLTQIDQGVEEYFNFDIRFAHDADIENDPTVKHFRVMFDEHPAVVNKLVEVSFTHYPKFSKVPRGRTGFQTTHCDLMLIRSSLTTKGKRRLRELEKAYNCYIRYDIETDTIEARKTLSDSKILFDYLSQHGPVNKDLMMSILERNANYKLKSFKPAIDRWVWAKLAFS